MHNTCVSWQCCESVVRDQYLKPGSPCGITTRLPCPDRTLVAPGMEIIKVAPGMNVDARVLPSAYCCGASPSLSPHSSDTQPYELMGAMDMASSTASAAERHTTPMRVRRKMDSSCMNSINNCRTGSNSVGGQLASSSGGGRGRA